MKIVLASGNQGKLKEFSQLLAPCTLEIHPQSDFDVIPPAETGLTFIENAIIKARYASEISGFPALSDDSGLSIDALDGRPGIYSARYSNEVTQGHATDQSNIDLVLEQLKSLKYSNRRARFHCVLVYMSHAADPTPLICHGQWEGEILEQQSGVGGFGYDPIFYVPEFKCTAAELSKMDKNSVSHRGKALRQLISQIDQIKS